MHLMNGADTAASSKPAVLHSPTYHVDSDLLSPLHTAECQYRLDEELPELVPDEATIQSLARLDPAQAKTEVEKLVDCQIARDRQLAFVRAISKSDQEVASDLCCDLTTEIDAIRKRRDEFGVSSQEAPARIASGRVNLIPLPMLALTGVGALIGAGVYFDWENAAQIALQSDLYLGEEDAERGRNARLLVLALVAMPFVLLKACEHALREAWRDNYRLGMGVSGAIAVAAAIGATAVTMGGAHADEAMWLDDSASPPSAWGDIAFFGLSMTLFAIGLYWLCVFAQWLWRHAREWVETPEPARSTLNELADPKVARRAQWVGVRNQGRELERVIEGIRGELLARSYAILYAEQKLLADEEARKKWKVRSLVAEASLAS